MSDILHRYLVHNQIPSFHHTDPTGPALRPHENPKRGKPRSECRSCHLGPGCFTGEGSESSHHPNVDPWLWGQNVNFPGCILWQTSHFPCILWQTSPPRNSWANELHFYMLASQLPTLIFILPLLRGDKAAR